MGVSGKLEAGAIIITFVDSGISLVNDSSPINILSNTGQLITAYFSKIPGATIAVAPAAAVFHAVDGWRDGADEGQPHVRELLCCSLWELCFCCVCS